MYRDHLVDSTCIPVCHNKRIKRNKVCKDVAQIGKSTMGWYYGFKLHLVCNDRGELLNFCLAKANVDDRNPEIFNVLSKELFGKLYADKGYISKTLFETINDKLKNIVHAVHSRHKRTGKLSNEYDFSNHGILLFPKETSYQMGNRNTEPIGTISLRTYPELRLLLVCQQTIIRINGTMHIFNSQLPSFLFHS